MFDKLLGIEARFENVNEQLCDPATVSDQQLYTKLMKELKQLTPVVEKFREYKKAKETEEEALLLLEDAAGNDPDWWQLGDDKIALTQTGLLFWDDAAMQVLDWEEIW